jgi:hypothetical protein
MKKVSILGLSFLSAIAFSMVILFNACSSDPCKDVTCLNGGTCVSGTCNCANGYEGTNCDTKTQDRYAGSYSAVDVCTSGNYSYNATVAPSSTDITKILMTNFGGFGSSVVVSGTVAGSSFTVPSQSFGAVTISGNGTLASDNLTINVSYTANDTGGNSDVCQGTWAKQ